MFSKFVPVRGASGSKIGDCILISQIRFSSQLYPTTSHRWDEAMVQAETIVGNSSNFSNLQQWVSGEFNNITKYLAKLIGTSHPMLETAKRCTYISEGKMGSAQARGLTVMLTAKAVEPLTKYSLNSRATSTTGKTGGITSEQLARNQISLAEMTEMTYSAYMIHRGVVDLKMHGLEEAQRTLGAGSQASTKQGGTPAVDAKAEMARYALGLHYGNKVSVLCGDFLLAYVMRGLGDLFSSKVVDLVASAITDFMEGEFMLIDDWRSQNYLITEESRNFKRWQRRTQSTIGSLQGNTCQAALVLGNIEGRLQRDARQFGTNLGLAWQAHTELQPFLKDQYEAIELPEMAAYPAFDLNCLPVLFFLKQAHSKGKNFRLLLEDIKLREQGEKVASNWGMPSPQTQAAASLLNQHRHQETVDYEKLHRIVLNERQPVEETYKIIRDYSERAMRNLDSFPPTEAKEVLLNICESLYSK